MDYQIVPKSHNHFMFVISLLLIFSLLPYCLCIVNRDLVLTPKQGLQLSGKRIFYEENYNNNDNNAALHHNNSVAEMGTRPWERTLKHVTYLTLFTNAANGIITGNFSKVKEYNEFLSSAYIHSANPLDSRFGDIVTLAQGRLEIMSNGSYRFVEGNCDYECARDNNIIAMWHVQKIRHRDTADRKYHYEMKFSVSPMTAKLPTETVVRGGPNKRTIMEERRNNVQTFIQKEDDYPLSFRKIVSDKDEDFTERRYDAARNFRQVSQPHYQTHQVTPIPQSTFLRGVYHPPPPPPAQMQQQHQHLQQPSHHMQHHNHHAPQQLPLPERLNIGEFYKGNYMPKAPTKIELFPNLLNMFMGKPQNHLPPPTTYRPPTYQMKFPRPEIYALQQHQTQEFSKFPEYHHPHPPSHTSQEQFTQRSPTPVPMVTHHYHHHFFMPNNSGITLEQAVHHQSGEQNQEQQAEIYQNEVTENPVPQGYVTNFYEEPHTTTTLRQHQFPQPQYQQQGQYHANIQRLNNYHQNYQSNQNYHFPQVVPPAPQKFVFPNTQIEQQHVVHVTPAPPLKKPQYHQQTQQHQYQHQQFVENRPFSSSLEYTTVHVPLLISYPAPINEAENADVATPRNKPFVQSDPIEDTIRYSEPDPLYTHVNEGEIDNVNKYLSNEEHTQQEENLEPQLESPQQQFEQSRNNHPQSEDEPDNKKEHSESIEAQLPAPSKNTHVIEEIKTPEDIKAKIPEQNTSQSTTSIQVANEKTTIKSIKTEASNSIVSATKRPKIFALRNKRINLKTATTTSTTSNPSTTTSTTQSSTTATTKTSTTSKPQKNFVSTSSTESPLKIISRYRNSYARTSSTSTTTTEKPVLKWTPKRKFTNNKFMAIKTTTSPAKENEKETEEMEENKKNNANNDNEDIKTNESNNERITTSTKRTATAELPSKRKFNNNKFMVIKSTTPPVKENNKDPDETEESEENDENNENNEDSEDIKTNESNNLTNLPKVTTTTAELVLEPITEISNAITIGTSSTISSQFPSISSSTSSPLLAQTSQDETEIYEVLTQKSVSKSVSLKVGYNGEEIPVIVDDEENEVKRA